MKLIRTGALLKAIKGMSAYRYDPRLKIPSELLDFFTITPDTTAMYLFGVPEQTTAIADLAQMGPADLHALLIGDKILWQAWYNCRKKHEGHFSDAWEIIIP